jgi:hypothetical protein
LDNDASWMFAPAPSNVGPVSLEVLLALPFDECARGVTSNLREDLGRVADLVRGIGTV